MLSKKNLIISSKILPSCEIVYTYDIGICFRLINSFGYYEQNGYNYSEWPLYHFPEINQNDKRNLCESIANGSFKIQDLKATGLGAFYCMIEEYNSSSLNEKKIQTSDFVQSLYNSLLSMKNSLYAHCHLESWEFEIQFFPSYEELEKDFFGRYEGEFIPWNEMNDKEFESYIKDFEEPGLALLTPHRR